MYFRTEDGKSFKHSDYKTFYVMPNEDGQWMLVVESDVEKKEERQSSITDKVEVATFKSVAHANQAQASLADAAHKQIGWDAIEFKQSLEPIKYGTEYE